MDFKAADPIINALQERAMQGIYGYTSRPIEYFEAIKKWQLEKNNWEVDTSLMSHALGVLPMLANLMHTFLEKGDKVLCKKVDAKQLKQLEDDRNSSTGNV